MLDLVPVKWPQVFHQSSSLPPWQCWGVHGGWLAAEGVPHAPSGTCWSGLVKHQLTLRPDKCWPMPDLNVTAAFRMEPWLFRQTLGCLARGSKVIRLVICVCVPNAAYGSFKQIPCCNFVHMLPFKRLPIIRNCDVVIISCLPWKESLFCKLGVESRRHNSPQ